MTRNVARAGDEGAAEARGGARAHSLAALPRPVPRLRPGQPGSCSEAAGASPAAVRAPRDAPQEPGALLRVPGCGLLGLLVLSLGTWVCGRDPASADSPQPLGLLLTDPGTQHPELHPGWAWGSCPFLCPPP